MAALEEPHPAFSPAFFVLCIVLTCIILLPLALARARVSNFVHIVLVQMNIIMAGNVVCFGFLVQGLTLPMFWREVSGRGWG